MLAPIPPEVGGWCEIPEWIWSVGIGIFVVYAFWVMHQYDKLKDSRMRKEIDLAKAQETLKDHVLSEDK